MDMNKVWVLTYNWSYGHGDFGSEVQGIFSSKEKADNFKKEVEWGDCWSDTWDITEWEVQ